MKSLIRYSLGGVCAVLISAVAQGITVSTEVVQGQWSSDYKAARAYAEANHLPMLIYWGSANCPKCKKMTAAMEAEDFIAWQAQQNLVMVYAKDDTTSGCKSFVMNSSLDWPYMCVYWLKDDGTTVYSKFTGRSGTMLVKGGTLGSQLMRSVESVLTGWTGSGTVTPSDPTPVTPTPDPEPVISDPFAGNVSYTASCVGSDGKLLGAIYLKAAKASNGKSKLTGYLLGVDGKKYTMTRQTVTLNSGYVTASLVFPKISATYTVTLSASGISGTGIEQFTPGAFPYATGKLALGAFAGLTIPAGYQTISEIPLEYAFTPAAKKWNFGKTQALSYAKNGDVYELKGVANSAKPNVLGLNISYTATTGQFKGTCKYYLSNAASAQGKPKLKKYTVKINGFFINGEGVGIATIGKTASAEVGVGSGD